MTRPLTIDIDIQAGGWRDAPVAMDMIARCAVRAAWRDAGTGVREAEVSIVLGDDALVRRLNAAYRGQDKATNVLSFPGDDETGPQSAPRLLGDIVLAYETVAREAREQGKTMPDHAAHLCVHGLLHLLGHDHEDDGDAAAMEALETAIVATLGIADPFLCAATAMEQDA
jgi:probable rRNA maturation factor